MRHTELFFVLFAYVSYQSTNSLIVYCSFNESANIFNKFLDVLKRIEDGELDQHEGSFMVGTLLKELYIDSAIKKSEKLDTNVALAR